MKRHSIIQSIGEEHRICASPEGVIRMTVHEYENTDDGEEKKDLASNIVEILRAIMLSNGLKITLSEKEKSLMFEDTQEFKDKPVMKRF